MVPPKMMEISVLIVSLERLHSVSIICVMSPSDAVDLESPLLDLIVIKSVTSS